MLGNRIGYLFLILLTGLFAVLYNEYFTLIIFASVLILPLLLLGVAVFIAHSIDVEMKVSAVSVKRGEKKELLLYISNKSIFPLTNIVMPIIYGNITSGITYKKSIKTSIDSKSNVEIKWEVTSNHSGILQFELKRVKVYDFLCLWCVHKKIKRECAIYVLPNIYDMDQSILNVSIKAETENDNYSKQKPGDDASEVFEIRDYKDGDRLNRIHWKLSMRKNRLLVKEFSDPLENQVEILLQFVSDNGLKKQLVKDEMSQKDGFLDCIASVSNACYKNGYCHNIRWYSSEEDTYKSVLVDKNVDKLSKVEEILELKTCNITKQKQIHNITLPAGLTNLIYITNRLSEEEIQFLLTLQRCFIIVFYVNDLKRNPLDGSKLEILMENDVAVTEIDSNDIAVSLSKEFD